MTDWLDQLRSPARRRMVGWLRAMLQRGFMPFRGGEPLAPAERRAVAAIWALAGALFACVWAGALALLLLALGRESVALVALALVPGAALFFGVAGYLTAGVGNSLIGRGTGGQSTGARGRGDQRGHLG